MPANGILVADASGTLRRVPSSATASISNSPHGGSGAALCAACNVPMKAVTNGTPQWFERLAHVALDDPYGVAELLDSLRLAGAHEQAAALLACDPAAHASLDNLFAVVFLLDRLRAAGAREQATALAGRLRRPACSGSSSTRTAPQISSVSDGRLTAPRPRHGAGKTWTYVLSSSAGTCCTGAGLSGMPTWAGMRHGSAAHGRQHRNRRDELNNTHPNRPNQFFEAQLA
jgi:hypothetical protein